MTLQYSFKRFCLRTFPRPALHLWAYRNLIVNGSSYLHQTGWLKSLRSGIPMDREGHELPWMNYPVVRFLEERLSDDLRVFEYGSGYSTVFYARRVRTVVSVEHDEAWLRNIRSRIPMNARIVHCPKDIDGAYCRTVLSTGEKFDAIVIDGRDRVHCMQQSISALTPRGIVILDDSQRPAYRQALDFARHQGFRHLHFEGLKPTGSEIDRTTILYKDGNCLDI